MGHTGRVTRAVEGLELRGRGAGDRHDELVGAGRLEGGGGVSDRAEHRHALHAPASEPRVVVQEADPEGVIAPAQIVDDAPAPTTRTRRRPSSAPLPASGTSRTNQRESAASAAAATPYAANTVFGKSPRSRVARTIA